MKNNININWEEWDNWHKLPQKLINDIADLIFKIITISFCDKKEIKILDVGTGTAIISAPLFKTLNDKLLKIGKKLIPIGVEKDEKVKERMFKNFKNNWGNNFEINEINSNDNFFQKIDSASQRNSFFLFWKNVFEISDNYKFDVVFIIDFIHYLKKGERENFINKIEKWFENGSIVVLGISGGDIKYIVGDENAVKGIPNGNHKNFWEEIHKKISREDNYLKEYLLPTDEENIKKDFENSKYQEIASFYHFWNIKTTYKNILEIYEKKAMSLFRISKAEFNEPSLSDFQGFLQNECWLFFSKKIYIYEYKKK